MAVGGAIIAILGLIGVGLILLGILYAAIRVIVALTDPRRDLSDKLAYGDYPHVPTTNQPRGD